MEDYPKIGIMILNHNGMQWLKPLYRSVKDDEYPNTRVYLVDNGGNDGSIEMTAREHPEVTILSLPRNLGYCMAYNLAMPYALADGCEWLIWSNNDVLLEPGCLRNLAAACRAHRGIGVAGPAFLAWQGNEPNAYMKGNHARAIGAMQARSEIPIDVDWVEGSFLMVSRSCLEKTGFLDPFLFAYWEEADFCRRARFQGYRVILVPNALARHFGGASWGCTDLRDYRRQLLGRNSYIYRLANPERSFARNLLSGLYHFCLRAKEAVASLSGVGSEIRLFIQMLSEMAAIHRKWANDRAGNWPPPVTEGYEGARVKVVCRANSAA